MKSFPISAHVIFFPFLFLLFKNNSKFIGKWSFMLSVFSNFWASEHNHWNFLYNISFISCFVEKICFFFLKGFEISIIRSILQRIFPNHYTKSKSNSKHIRLIHNKNVSTEKLKSIVHGLKMQIVGARCFFFQNLKDNGSIWENTMKKKKIKDFELDPSQKDLNYLIKHISCWIRSYLRSKHHIPSDLWSETTEGLG